MKRFISTSMILVCLPSMLAFSSNARLSQVQDFYQQTLTQQSNGWFKSFTEYLTLEMDRSTSKIEGSLSGDVESIHQEILERDIAKAPFKTPNMSHQEFLQSYLDAVSKIHQDEQWLHALGESFRINNEAGLEEQKRINSLTESEGCLGVLAKASWGVLPSYPRFDEIDLSKIPRPSYDTVGWGHASSSDESAKEIEGKTMTAATLAGSGIGTALCPGVGTLIGLGVGALVGWISGKAAAAAKVAWNNHREWKIYESACHVERARQEEEIRVAQAWVDRNPITAVVIKEKAAEKCNQSDWQKDWKETRMTRWNQAVQKLFELTERVERALNEKGEVLSLAKAKIAEAQLKVKQSGVEDLSDAVLKPLVSRFEAGEQKSEMERLNGRILSQLYICFQRPRQSCANKKKCIEEAQSAMDQDLGQLHEKWKTNGGLLESSLNYQMKNWQQRLGNYLEVLETCRDY